jgi:hypothetical protein
VYSIQKYFLPKYDNVPMRDRLEAVRQGAFNLRDPSTFRFLLTGDKHRPIPTETVRISIQEKISVVHSVAIALGKRYPTVVEPPVKKVWPTMCHCSPAWCTLVSEAIEGMRMQDLHSIETVTPWSTEHIPVWTGTPLVSLIGGALSYLAPRLSMVSWDKVLRETLFQWLQTLQDAGVDLFQYGQREAGVFLAIDEVRGAFDGDAIAASRMLIRPAMAPESEDAWIMGLGHVKEMQEQNWIPIRLVQVDFGRDPEDWRLWWAPEFEIFAEEFWKMATRPVYRMPGSWVD